MFTRFFCEAMLYFDSKRMWLNDTTQFIYISGKCKFAHNKALDYRLATSSGYSSIVMVSTSSYFSRIFFIRGFYPISLTRTCFSTLWYHLVAVPSLAMCIIKISLCACLNNHMEMAWKAIQCVVTLVKFTFDAMKSWFCVVARNRLQAHIT